MAAPVVPSNREAAFATGNSRYEGMPCVQGHTERYTSSCKCVMCTAIYKERRRKLPGGNIKGDRANKRRRDQLRAEIIEAYGGKCSCNGCPEQHKEFLGLDHLEGGGKKHRELLGKGRSGGGAFYRWIRDQGFPKDKFRLLCHNCNISYGLYGYCPHQKLVCT